jgi:hypothetical protein
MRIINIVLMSVLSRTSAVARLSVRSMLDRDLSWREHLNETESSFRTYTARLLIAHVDRHQSLKRRSWQRYTTGRSRRHSQVLGLSSQMQTTFN